MLCGREACIHSDAEGDYDVSSFGLGLMTKKESIFRCGSGKLSQSVSLVTFRDRIVVIFGSTSCHSISFTLQSTVKVCGEHAIALNLSKLEALVLHCSQDLSSI